MYDNEIQFTANRWVNERLEPVEITINNIYCYLFCKSAEEMINLTKYNVTQKIPVYIPR